MFSKEKKEQTLYKTPFTAAYWRDAASQLFDIRILCLTAILIALRVALKSAQIFVGPELAITFGFFVNSLGASIFGPVVAIFAAAITDTLGCIFFPTGTYFFPFIFVEIAGSLIFALFLWRTKLTTARIIFSRFTVSVVCNLILNSSIMIWYYSWLGNGTNYAFMTVPRVVKNLALFPLEAFLLVLFFSAVIPVLAKLKIYSKEQVKLVFTKAHLILLAVLLVIAIVIVILFYSLWMPTQPFSASVTEDSIKVTLKSQMKHYKLDDMDPEAPFTFTATIKNNAKTDIEAVHLGDLCEITLVAPEGVELPKLDTPAIVEVEETTTIAAGKSVKLTETFADLFAAADSFPKGDYTAVATFDATVDGNPIEIVVELPIKVK